LGQQIFWCLTSPFASSSPSSPHHPFFQSQLLLLALTDDSQDGGESKAFSLCSPPLSTALDTAVLEASSHVTDGNTLNFKSAECERVFSSVKKMATAERNRLSEDIIQACECLKAWWDNGFMEWRRKEEEEGEGALSRASYKCISIETNSRQSLPQSTRP
jgi:hypothetical protein